MELTAAEPAQDRRVRRSRAALMQAAVALVTERGTTAIPLSDIAEAADMSRRVVYQHFGDRDTLLLEAGLDLVRQKLLPRIETDTQATARELTLAVSRHFADYRVFYRALLTGSGGFAIDRGLSGLFRPVNRQGIEQVAGDRLDPRLADDLAAVLTGGAGAFITTWVVDGPDPLDPEAFTDRLLHVMSVLMTAIGRAAGKSDAEALR
ncbi:TetR/AcrR family transcriptional regulator [Kibdelosporangium aridum]|uniref:TetR/AcrR family transcriptional regulator n=1 Tax=Kibdelosporangium aridum TaxID=2030 RepID=A0A428YQE7_KIBAR|nr:TetR/AcrR family transcriptional regulator [Kibdelosporangium aridum]RSM70780.1 TetR/AcrR family transcriptional regulator [Kibdelosporangium aridum]